MEKKVITLPQIYNCNETGLCYRLLPEKTLAAKERVTLMACSNATGNHMLPLLFVGKAMNPQCFTCKAFCIKECMVIS